MGSWVLNAALVWMLGVGVQVAVAQDDEALFGDAAFTSEAAPGQAAQKVEKDAGKKSDASDASKKEGDQDKSKGDKKGKEGESKDDEKKESPKSIKRPTEMKQKPDPQELEITPGADGRVSFSFHGQPWLQVLKWLADTSSYSLDWQELPPDQLNLASDKRYTLVESRNLFNRLLLDRGYTMVLQGQVLSVFKIEKLEPSLLPRIEDESELLDRQPYDFVKITFKLPDELKAEQAAKDIKPLLSPHAKVQPLLSTNRLLVIGTVANLRAVSRLLNAEHAAARGHVVPREFIIQHERADNVADQVMILLGLDPASRRTPQELQLEQSRLQLFTQMQQKGKDVSKFIRKDGATVFITVNMRRNSILVNAPPKEMKIIERSIESIDKGAEDNTSTASVNRISQGASVQGGPSTMQKYPLVTLDPQSVVTALEQIGTLAPKTMLNIDQKAKTIFAYASASDHEKIRSMIDGLDGSERQFEVIWLRHLPADRMAATIHALMVGKEEEKQTGYSYYSYRYRQREDEDKDKGFRIDADIEQNRLLLWATPAELKEVNKFLMKMGETPGGGGNPSTVRLLDPRGDDATLRVLQQIRQAWPSIGPNELIIEGTKPLEPKLKLKQVPGNEAKETKEATPVESDSSEEEDSDAQSGIDLRTTKVDRQRMQTRLVQVIQKEDTSDANAEGETPPIKITVTSDGRIMLSSKDTKALDRIEQLLAQIAPPAKDFDIFYLKYAFASTVVANLKEFFAEDAEFNTEDNWWRAWNGLSFEESSSGTGLSSRRKMRFIYDFDTNSVLVSNASPGQLATVSDLIAIYDKAPSEESISARRFSIFKLKHARAEKVAATLKEVYRDLLSSKDKEFAKDPKNEQKSSVNSGYVRVYGGIGANKKDQKPAKVRQSFAGALSVGVDVVSNTVIISAQEEWMSSISQMVEYLDSAAQPYRGSVAYHRAPKQFASKEFSELIAALASNPKQEQVKPNASEATKVEAGQPPQGQSPEQKTASP